MRTKEAILEEIEKVIKADKDAARKQARCEARLVELDKELEETQAKEKAPADAGTSEADA